MRPLPKPPAVTKTARFVAHDLQRALERETLAAILEGSGPLEQWERDYLEAVAPYGDGAPLGARIDARLARDPTARRAEYAEYL